LQAETIIQYMENKTFPIWEAFCAKIKTKKTFLFISTPILFVVFVALDFCIAKYYESELVIMRESEQAVEVNRAITLNRPEQYDLGLARTDNAVRTFGYEPIVESTQFMSSLLNTPVSKLDGSWSGTYEEYILNEAHHPFWERAYGAIINGISDMRYGGGSANDIQNENKGKLLTMKQTIAIADMKKNISIKTDKLTEVITIKVRTQDPHISMQVAQAISANLKTFLGNYEREKMQVTLTQLEQLVAQAKETYSKEVYESFERQMIVYKAQMLFHPSFMELATPQICYKGAGPSRWKMPLVLTILMELLAMMWFGREEVKEILKQL